MYGGVTDLQSDVAKTGPELISPEHHRRIAMEHFAGIDVSLEKSSVCVVDSTGKIVRETKVASEPEAHPVLPRSGD
jgi:hypothetical protein